MPQAWCPGLEEPKGPPSTSLGPWTLGPEQSQATGQSGSGPRQDPRGHGRRRRRTEVPVAWVPPESGGHCPVEHCWPRPGSGRGRPSQTAAWLPWTPWLQCPSLLPKSAVAREKVAPQEAQGPEKGSLSLSPTPELGAPQGRLIQCHRPLSEPLVGSPWVVSQTGKLRPTAEPGPGALPQPQGYTRLAWGWGSSAQPLLPWPSRSQTLSV